MIPPPAPAILTPSPFALDRNPQYLENGALSVSAVLSHLALSDGDVAEMMRDSPHISRIISTNSHPMSQHAVVRADKNKFVIADVSHLFADSIVRQLQVPPAQSFLEEIDRLCDYPEIQVYNDEARARPARNSAGQSMISRSPLTSPAQPGSWGGREGN